MTFGKEGEVGRKIKLWPLFEKDANVYYNCSRNYKMRVKKCCCGCSLHDGCIVIGILQLVFTGIGACVCIAALSSSEFIDNLIDTICGNYNYATDAKDMYDFCKTNDGVTAMKLYFGITLAACLVNIFVAALLIHGARSRKPGFLLPWLILTTLGLMANIVVNVYQMITIGTTMIFSGLINIAVTILISGYCILVVSSYRKQLMEERGGQNHRGQQNTNPYANQNPYGHLNQQPYMNQGNPYMNQPPQGNPYMNQAPQGNPPPYQDQYGVKN